MSSDLEEQQDELLALLSIFDPEEFVRNESKSSGEFRVRVELPKPFSVALKEGNALSKYDVSSLPPLCLTFDLPEDYPSCSAPSYSLNCYWLTPTQLSSLAAQLDDLYQTTGGAVVLFSWAQFLKHEALDFLGITDVLEISSNEHTTEEDGSAANVDSLDDDLICQNKKELTSEENTLDIESATSEAADNEGASNFARLEHQTPLSLSPGQALLSQLLIHDAVQKDKAFSSQQFDCGVCFMSRLGADCVQLSECGHVFCRTCFAEFCKVQITNGTVREVTCLEAGCKAAPTPAQVKSVVDEELFSRFDRLLLQSTLDSMSDVMYCPRPSCATAVLTDSSSSMALCTVCSFAFCARCKKTYHGPGACYTRTVQKKPATQNLLDHMPQTNKGMKALWEDYTTGTRERKKLLEKWYGKKTLMVFLEECLSVDWKSSNSKSCPQCFSQIEKIGGCNRMTCSRCQLVFCWNCLSKFPPGARFSYSCCAWT